MEITTARYDEYKIHRDYDNLLTLIMFEGIDNVEMEALYALGYYLFTYGDYESAKDIFTGLTAYDSDNEFYWRALGAVNQQLENYPEAIAAYDSAIDKDASEIVSYIYRGEIHILVGDIEEGIKNFKQALNIETKSTESQPWKDRAELLLNVHQPSSG